MHTPSVALSPFSSALVVLALASPLATIAPTDASACSCIHSPHWGFMLEGSGIVPSNVPGIVWVGAAPSPSDFVVERVGQGKARPVAFTITPLQQGPLYLIALKTPPKVGERYAFTTTLFERYRFKDTAQKTQRVQVTVSPHELALKPSDVSVAISEPELGSVSVSAGSMCSGPIRARRAEVRLVLPAKQRPFRHLLAFETQVDGARWMEPTSLCQVILPGRSRVSEVGEDEVFAGCPAPVPEGQARVVRGANPNRGLKPGQHRVSVRASAYKGIPNVSVTAAASADVTLVCDP